MTLKLKLLVFGINVHWYIYTVHLAIKTYDSTVVVLLAIKTYDSTVVVLLGMLIVLLGMLIP